jgi:hypothetical protein
MKTTNIALLLVVALLIVCLIIREPTTIIVVLSPENQLEQLKTIATIHPEPVPKFHGFAMA